MVSADLAGDVAVVTGAAGQLGTVWVTSLLRAGADVAGIDVVPKVSELVEAEASRCAGRYRHLVADVTDRESLQRSLAECINEFAVPTVLVNNAGVDTPPSSHELSWRFEEIPDSISSRVLEVNAMGVLRVCQVYGAAMVQEKRGSIINIGSIYGRVAPQPALYRHIPINPPFLKPPAYGISKAGVAALSRYLATLWAPAGVRVNTLSPGGVLSSQDPIFQREFAARTPMARMARSEDLAGPLLFLASDLSSYVTGQELVVDGGFTCW